MPGLERIGKYEILEEIGRGGFAVVYKARDPTLNRVIALKVLAPHLTWDPTFAERFRREAQSTARLRHPHIVTIHEVGQDGERLYIAMEYLPGRTLARLLEDEGAVSLERALSILEQVADALDYAHNQDVIHRDVKPRNIMVEETRRGVRVTLMDFGLVKAMESSEGLTSAGIILGSPEYMAPEQADPDRRDEIGPATDRYALGVVAYEMLTGRVPFPGSTPSTLVAHMQKLPPDPQIIREDLPASVARVLLKALFKSPRGRHPTAMAMVEALRQAQALAEKEVEAVEGRVEEEGERRRLPPTQPPRKRFPTWGWVAGVIVVALLIGSVWLGPLIWGKIAPEPTATPTVAADTPTPTPTRTPTSTYTPTSTPTSTPTRTPTPTYTPTSTPTLTPTPTPLNMVYVPAGKFWMGSSDEDIDAILAECSDCEREWYTDEQPQHEVYLDAFWIDRTEVTNEQYRHCVEAGACTPPKSSGSYSRDSYYGHPNFDDYPVIYVDWSWANAYCRWAGKRLPTEAEWEKAARGTDKRLYPWGDEAPDEARLNYDINIGDTTEVGSYPGGASPYDALDMAGNVWEWTSSLYKSYPYDEEDGREALAGGGSRVVRGGAWNFDQRYARAAGHYIYVPSDAYNFVGFRCARSGSES